MSLKLKVLGMGLLAIVATGAFAVVSANATLGGHFTHDAAGGHASIVGTEAEGTKHVLHLYPKNAEPGQEIGCKKESYTGTITSATTQSITITPLWSECSTTSGEATWEVHENGCTLTFTSGKTGSASHTVDVLCPAGNAFVITHPNCTITVGPQTVSGATYTTTVEGKHALTLNVAIGGIAAQYHGGICIFLGTNQTSEMKGSVTIKGFNTAGEQVNITETTG
jgi:hypothetical protein